MLLQLNNMFLTFSSISWMLLLFLLNNFNLISSSNNVLIKIFLIVIFIIIKSVFTGMELNHILPKYDNDNFNDVIEIENMDSTLLPIYLGYFFIALSVDSIFIFSVVFTIILIFVCCTNTEYYNPMLLIFRYHFYKIKNADGIILFIVTKQNIRNSAEKFDFLNLKRMSNFTFLDIEKRKI